MPKIRDVAGQVFGKLTAQAVDGKDSTGKTRWLCMCACGNTTTATMLNLVKGVTKSCGCLRNGPSANRLNLAFLSGLCGRELADFVVSLHLKSRFTIFRVYT